MLNPSQLDRSSTNTPRIAQVGARRRRVLRGHATNVGKHQRLGSFESEHVLTKDGDATPLEHTWLDKKNPGVSSLASYFGSLAERFRWSGSRTWLAARVTTRAREYPTLSRDLEDSLRALNRGTVVPNRDVRAYC